LGTFERNPKFGDLEGGRKSGNLGTFGTNPKFGDLGTNHTLNLGTKKPIKVLKLFWLILNKAFSKILSWSLKKKKGFV
jgi:aryl-phospho-beta-D-glucosidase BglC (GH1 family)